MKNTGQHAFTKYPLLPVRLDECSRTTWGSWAWFLLFRALAAAFASSLLKTMSLNPYPSVALSQITNDGSAALHCSTRLILTC